MRYYDGERVGVLGDVRVTRVLRRMIIKPFAILVLRTFWYRDKTARGFSKDVSKWAKCKSLATFSS